MYQFKNPTTKEGLNLGDVDEEKTLEEELKAKLKPPTKLMKHTTEEIIDILVPHVMEKTIEVVNLIPQEQVQNHRVEQFIDKAVDVPIIVQRQVPIVQKVQKTVEVFQTQFINKVVDVPVHMQRQVPAVQVVQKTAEATRIQFIDRAVDIPAEQQRQVPMVQTVQKTVEIPQILASQAENHHATQEAERYQDEDKVCKAKIKTKSGLENHFTAMRNTSTVKELRSKFEVGHDQEAHARNRSDKDAQKKANLTNQRPLTAIRSAQKTVEVQEMTRSLVQGEESMLVDETDARSLGREMVQVIHAEWSQELREVQRKFADDMTDAGWSSCPQRKVRWS